MGDSVGLSAPMPYQPADRFSTGPVGDTSGADRLQTILHRLRELGAVYYLLETWGNSGQSFRFHCRTAIGGSPSYTRYFEATDSSPIQAMEKVLAEVELWRAGY